LSSTFPSSIPGYTSSVSTNSGLFDLKESGISEEGSSEPSSVSSGPILSGHGSPRTYRKTSLPISGTSPFGPGSPKTYRKASLPTPPSKISVLIPQVIPSPTLNMSTPTNSNNSRKNVYVVDSKNIINDTKKYSHSKNSDKIYPDPCLSVSRVRIHGILSQVLFLNAFTSIIILIYVFINIYMYESLLDCIVR
jgi:hypothetical protein